MRLFQRLESLALALVIVYLSLDVQHAAEWRKPLLLSAALLCGTGAVGAMIERVRELWRQR